MIVARLARELWAELREGDGRALLHHAVAVQRQRGQQPTGPLITISRRTKKLRLYEGTRRLRTYRVALGWGTHETQAGLFALHDKEVDPEWHVPDAPWAGALAGRTVPGGASENLIKARWMGVYEGVGIHGTDRVSCFGLRIESSRGCIRMRIADVIALYDRVPDGTPVFIR